MALSSGIEIDPNRDAKFDENGIIRLKESYLAEGEVSPQERFAFVSNQFGTDQDHADRLYDYASKHWLSYSTPILAYGRDKKALPISCYLNYIPDTAEGLVDNLSETSWLSMLGGGVGIGFGIRSPDEKSTGVIPILRRMMPVHSHIDKVRLVVVHMRVISILIILTLFSLWR